MQIRIDSPILTGSHARYVVHVIAPGPAVVLVPGGKPRLATLEVNGEIRQAGGTSVMIGVQPLGKSIVSLVLGDVRTTDTVVVRVERGDGTLHAVSDIALLTTATRSSLFSGMYIAFALCIAVFAAAQWLKTRELNSLWFAIWVFGTALVKVGLDGFLGSSSAGVLFATISIILIGCGMTGFVTTYIQLRRVAPRLFWFVLGVAGVSFLIPPAGVHVFGDGVERLDLLAPLVGMTPLFPAAVMRWRQGFRPAGFLIAALAAQYVTFAVQFALSQSSAASHWLNDSWNFAIAACYFALFGCAATMRQRYIMREQDALEEELRCTKFDAQHDPLTGLLNRRGLEAWIREAAAVSTVFFIDLDGFKAVNDGGGHAAGDDVLRSASRIIRRNVRVCDAVARVGGDEFIVAFAGEPTDAAILRVREQISLEVDALEPLGPDNPTRIGASIGIGFTTGDRSIDAALEAADADAYRVKFDRYASAVHFARRTEL